MLSLSVPGQPGKFKVGKVTDTNIELTWEPAYTKEGIVNYELLYKPVKFGTLVRPLIYGRSVYLRQTDKRRTKRSFKD